MGKNLYALCVTRACDVFFLLLLALVVGPVFISPAAKARALVHSRVPNMCESVSQCIVKLNYHRDDDDDDDGPQTRL